jgi:hypothetical protein
MPLISGLIYIYFFVYLTLFQLCRLYGIKWYDDCESITGKDKVLIAYFNALRHLTGGTEENHKNLSG